MYNHFTWCEVTSFDLSEAMCFYENVFGWEMSETIGNYSTCYSDGKQSAGLLKMTRNFREAELPSFWLPYVRVDSLFDMVNLAVELGGKIEVHPSDFIIDGEKVGRYALVRDTAGAGLMLYEGEDLGGLDEAAKSDARMVTNQLHVDSVYGVSKFYEQLFGWKFTQDPDGYRRYVISDMKGKKVGSLIELDKKNQGVKNCWMIHFAVKDVGRTLRKAKNFGGLVIIDLTDTDYAFALVQDTQGAFFCIRGAA